MFWTEAFENGCISGCIASTYVGPNGAWTIAATGVNGNCPNEWFISCAENGQNAGACGAGCGSDESLHIGNQACSPFAPAFCPTGDCGAAYDADATCTALLCSFFLCNCSPPVSSQADRRAESPVIDASGQTNVVISFNYIELGQGTQDDATVWYNDGTTWMQVDNPPKTVSCGLQHQWANRTFALPASADNNPNIRIGFRWVNDNDGNGADPSFAVDDVEIIGDASLPVGLESFHGFRVGADVHLVWQTDVTPGTGFEVERSADGLRFESRAILAPHTNPAQREFTFIDYNALEGSNFYRLRISDQNGEIAYSNAIEVSGNAARLAIADLFPNPVTGGALNLRYFTPTASEVELELVSVTGQLVTRTRLHSTAGLNSLRIDTDAFANGLYFLRLRAGTETAVRQVAFR